MQLSKSKLRPSRSGWEIQYRLWFALGQLLNNQRPLQVGRGFGAVMFHASLPVTAQEVEAKAVRFFVVEIEEFELEACPLLGIDVAFEDGILDALSEIEAGAGDFGKPAFADFVDR